MQQLYIGWRIKGFKRFVDMGRRYNLSPEAQFRLSVIGYYHNGGQKNSSKTARHFGLHRNTVGKWLAIFDPNNLHSLEPSPRAPIHRYRRTTPEHIVQMVVAFKKKYPFLGKDKISVIFERDKGIIVKPSTVGRIIKRYKLTYLWRTAESACNFKKTVRKRKGRKRPPKTYINKKPGKWIQIDTIRICSDGKSVYVITAVDLATRLGVAKAYKSPSSSNAKDFLMILRMFYPAQFSIRMIHSDNGSEFLKYFDATCVALNIDHVFSYPRTPDMHGYVESFNGTIQREWLKKKDALLEPIELNKKIAEYLVFYNSFRPHKHLDYKTPLQVYCDYWSTSEKVHTMLWTHSLLEFPLLLFSILFNMFL
jgi:transposase InsO family protein